MPLTPEDADEQSAELLPAEGLSLTAYCQTPDDAMPLQAAPQSRDWMDATHQRYAYRCLPIVIANQSGWLLLSRHALAVTWSGGDSAESLELEFLSGEEPWPARGEAGRGILTWRIPYAFRTPPGYDLLVRGPANYPKDAIYPLESIVETEQAAGVSMSWQVTRPHHRIVFEQGEPICMIVPQLRGELELFAPEIEPISADPDLRRRYLAWVEARGEFNRELLRPGSDAAKQGWQQHYYKGISAGDAARSARGYVIDHQTSLHLAEFTPRS